MEIKFESRDYEYVMEALRKQGVDPKLVEFEPRKWYKMKVPKRTDLQQLEAYLVD